MGSKCIAIHYLESEKIQFMTNVFAKVEEAKLNIFHASQKIIWIMTSKSV